MYFYKSPYGGRVYFDDLGPPWPKHPCTDHVRTDLHPSGKLEKFVSKKETGWRPFFCTGLHSHQKEYGVIVLTSQNEHGETELYAHYDHKLVDHRSPFFIRKHITNQHCYEISTLNSQNQFPYEIRFSAFDIPPRSKRTEQVSDNSKKNKSIQPEEKVSPKLVADITSLTIAGSSRTTNLNLRQLLLSGDDSKVLAFMFNLYKFEWQNGQFTNILADCITAVGPSRVIDAFIDIDPKQTLDVKRISRTKETLHNSP